MRKLAWVVLACSLVATGAAGFVQAQTVQKERENFMKHYGDLSKELKALVADPSNLPRVASIADEIAAKSSQIPTLVPPGSEGGNALPVIWEKKPEFEAKAQNLGKLATNLAQTARSGDQPATVKAFGTMGQDGCGACHSTFRKKMS